MTVAMLLGPVGCGKTTLGQGLRGAELEFDKTQTIEVLDDVIDTPGEYVQHGHFNRALLLSSYEADVALLLESATEPEPRVPPGFATMFTCPVLGVATKIDVATPDDIAVARERLALAGATRGLEVSALTGAGMAHLRAALAELDEAVA